MENYYIDKINEILTKFENINTLTSKDIPNIDLYMDQVTTFMEDNLTDSKRNEKDKILTKTMINNYSKYGLLPPSIKKKYSNDHIILMLLIYNMKSVLSINDIKSILSILDPLHKDNTLKEFFDNLVSAEEENFLNFDNYIEDMSKSIDKIFDKSSFNNNTELELFSFCYLLTANAAAQKMLVTRLIDAYLTSNPKPIKKKPIKKKK